MQTSRPLRTVYVITMWSGGRAGKKWKTLKSPKLLPTGSGVTFRSMDTKLNVHVIGNLSVEEFEEGSNRLMEELQAAESEKKDEPEKPAAAPASTEVIL